MSMISINWRPDRRALVEFSELSMFFLGMVASPLAYLRGRPALAGAFWVAAVAIRLAGLWRPLRLRPVFLGLTLATWPIGWLVSHATLALLYHGVVTPIGLVLRLTGRDPLARRFDRTASTYWETYNPDRGMKQYLKQF